MRPAMVRISLPPPSTAAQLQEPKWVLPAKRPITVLGQARKAARRLRSEVVLGGDPSGAKADKKAIPFYADLAVQHLAHAKTYQRSYDSTEMIMRRHVVPHWGKQRLDEIRPHDIAKWLAAKSDEGLKPATVEKIRVVFSRSFELGRQWCIPGCDNNPVRAVPRRQFSNARERYLGAARPRRASVRFRPMLLKNSWLKLS